MRVREGEGGTKVTEAWARFTMPRRAVLCRVASCREDRNEFYPRDAAKRHGATDKAT